MYELYTSKINKNYPHHGKNLSKAGFITQTKFGTIHLTVGHDPLERFLQHLSKDIQLSQTDYTNHSVRATVLGTLDENEFQAHHIIAMSGHKSESSTKKYSRKCPKKIIKDMGNCLAENLPKRQKIEPATDKVAMYENDDEHCM